MHSAPTTQTAAPNFKTLTGVVERITYQNDESGYTVARLLPDRAKPSRDGGEHRSSVDAARGEDRLVTVVGTLLGVVAGEALELQGFWQKHPQHGMQFAVANYRSILPATAQGIRKYLGSGLIKGIGPRTADKIVDYYGERTLDILEGDPSKLIDVPKLGSHKVKLIRAGWAEQKAIKEVMLFLQGHGISTSLAVRIYKEYGDASITIVKNEPYKLAKDVWGIGFKTADKIAQSLGFGHADPERLKAGTRFVLSEASDSDGHTYLPRPQLVEKAAELLEVQPEQVDAIVDGLALDGGVHIEALEQDDDGSLVFAPVLVNRLYTPDNLKAVPKVAPSSSPATGLKAAESRALYETATPILSALPGEQAVSLPPFYYAEIGVAQNVRRLAKAPSEKDRLADLQKTNWAVMFDYLTEKGGFALADKQKEGVVMALTQPLAVLTGGPGTGKTTTLRALTRVLSLKKKRIVLAAPTGRAAKRLTEATGVEAQTLHRLLQLKPGGQAQFNRENPLPADVVIVDETSMLDVLLLNTLLKAVGTGAHLLLVGDADQLPSVGAGNVLADIINSGVVPVVRLETIFRQGAGSAIISNAHRINEGKMPVVGRDITDFFFFPEDDPDQIAETVVDLAARRIPARFGFKSDDIQILAPMHGGRVGVGTLNEKLQEALNPPRPGQAQKQFGGKTYRVGDKVLQLKNNYDKEVFNGDTGRITALNLEDQSVTVSLEDGRVIVYDFSELHELTLAYAVSIHKSQGSEYPVCVIPVAMAQFMLLERRLIYTAVTRAKKLVVIVGSKRALAVAINNGPKHDSAASAAQRDPKHRSGRYTGLCIRLRQQT